MIVRQNNIYAQIVDCTPQERKLATALMTFPVEGAHFTRAYKRGVWDGKKRLVNYRGVFPAGWVGPLRTHLAEHKHRLEVVLDLPAPIPDIKPFYDLKDIELYDFQREAVEAMLREQRGVLKAATSSGKTETAIAAIASVMGHGRRPPYRGLWVTHTKDLMRQTIERIGKRAPWVKTGQWGDNVKSPNLMTVAIVNSVSRALKKKDGDVTRWLAEMDFVVFDEAHLGSSPSLQLVAEACTGASFRWGLSATPGLGKDLDNAQLISITGNIIYEISAAMLVERGLVAEPHIMFLRHGAKPLPAELDWNKAYLLGIVENKARNIAVCKAAIRAANKGFPTLVLVVQKKHGITLARALSQFLPTEYLSGDDSLERRVAAVKRFREGDSHILVATTIMDVGVDIPIIGAQVLAGGMESSVRTYQRIGRGMRKKDGKSKVFVFDFVDTHQRYLHKHYRKRYGDCVAEKGYVVYGEKNGA